MLPLEANHTDAVCFVCSCGEDDCSEELLTGICCCRTLRVHASCQQRMMRLSEAHRNGCAICGQPYNNVTYRLVARPPLDPEAANQFYLGNLLVLAFHLSGAILGCPVCIFFFGVALLPLCFALFITRYGRFEYVREAVVVQPNTQSLPPSKCGAVSEHVCIKRD